MSRRAPSRSSLGSVDSSDRPDRDPKNTQDYTPLGVLICRWADLFPWLSQVIDNRLDQLEDVHEIVAWRILLQDALGLCSLYRVAENVDIDYPGLDSLQSLGDAFSALAHRLQERKSRDDNPVNKERMKESLQRLPGYARNVLMRWSELESAPQGGVGIGGRVRG